MVWVQIITDDAGEVLSVLIETVCKGYQQMTKVVASKERVKIIELRQFTDVVALYVLNIYARGQNKRICCKIGDTLNPLSG